VSISRNLGQASGAALVAVCFRLVPGNGPRTALTLGSAFAAVAAAASLLRLLAKPPVKPVGAE
jgi:DHA2 family multidrug resistance protein-like MFS transporter